MFKESEQIEKFEPKVWLSSPTGMQKDWMQVCSRIVCRIGSSSYGSKAGRSKIRRESFLF